MNKIRKGDDVVVTTGKDKGKRGVVLSCLDAERLLVEGVNRVKKHTKPNPMKGNQGGIVEKEMPINISNSMTAARFGCSGRTAKSLTRKDQSWRACRNFTKRPLFPNCLASSATNP